MSLPCDQCCDVERGSIVSRSENKMRFEIVNKSKQAIKVCKVDECLIKSAQKRCDYLFLVRDCAMLVELKGTDRNRALYQLIEAAEVLGSKSFDGTVQSYIVTSRVPRADTKYQSNMARLKKRYAIAKCLPPVQKNLCISIKV